MTDKRANHEGTIVARKGRPGYVGQIRYTDPVTGQAKRKAVYRRTRDEVADKLREIRDEVEAGKRPRAARSATFADYAREWIEVELKRLAVDGQLKPSTVTGYADALRHHVLPLIGERVQVSAITYKHVRQLALDLATEPVGKTHGKREPKVLGVSSRRIALMAFRRVLDTAVDDGILPSNVARQLPLPSRKAEGRTPEARAKKAALEPADVARLWAVLDDPAHRNVRALVLFVMFTGCRRADVIGVRWSDVDLGDGVGSAELSSKTAAGERAVALHPVLVEALRAHRREQVAHQLARRDYVESGHVFTSQRGTPLNPRNVSRRVGDVLAAAGLEGSTHRLRHHAASTMLANGISPADVAAILGHADAQTTLTIYAHKTAAGTARGIAALGGALLADEA